MKNFINKILLYFTPEKFTEIFFANGTWKLTYSNKPNSTYDEYCTFTILKSNKGKYKLTTSGYKPKDHSMYKEIFKKYRNLVEGKVYAEGGELFIKLDNLTIEEYQEKLQQAIKDENYELASKIKQLIEKKKDE
jgi:hypothetical protein